MSPLKIEIILHYYCCIDDHRSVGSGFSAQTEAIEWFLREDFLMLAKGVDAKYQITERGKAYCEALCSMPLPIFNPGFWSVPGIPHKVDSGSSTPHD